MKMEELINDKVAKLVVPAARRLNKSDEYKQIFVSFDITSEIIRFINESFKSYEKIDYKPDQIYFNYDLKNTKSYQVLDEEKSDKSQVLNFKNKFRIKNFSSLGVNIYVGFLIDEDILSLKWEEKEIQPTNTDPCQISIRFTRQGECWAVLYLDEDKAISININRNGEGLKGFLPNHIF